MANKAKTTILVFLWALFTSAFSLSSSHAKDETFKARITYYSVGKQVAWSKQKHGIPFVSVAAHPRFKFGTKIIIPALRGKVGSGVYFVHDRGPAVTARKASSGKTPVIDIYVSSNSNVRRFARTMPMYCEVTVHND